METVKIYCQEVGKGNPQLTYATNKIIPKLPAFYPDGKELPKGWIGEAKLTDVYLDNGHWFECDTWGNGYTVENCMIDKIPVKQAYIAIISDTSISPVGENDNSVSKECLHTQHTDVEALAEKEYPDVSHPMGNIRIDELRSAYIKGYTAALLKNEGWVRVSDRLPKAETKVLVVVSFNGFTEVRTDTYRIVDSYGNEKNWFHYHNVTHWMPLPEAPKQ